MTAYKNTRKKSESTDNYENYSKGASSLLGSQPYQSPIKEEPREQPS